MANGMFGFGGGVADTERRTRNRLLGEQEKRQQEMLASLLAGASSGEERLGLTVGSAIGGGLAKGLFGDQLDEKVEADPDVVSARESMALAEQMQALTTGENAVQPGSADFFLQSAQIANNAGRPGLALELGSKAVELRRTEGETAAKAAVKAAEQRRAEFNQLPTDAKLVAIVEDPTVLSEIRPNLSEAERTAIVTQIQGVVETRRLKNAAELNKIRPPRVTKPTSVDVNQTGALLEDAGLGQNAFTKWFGMRDDPEKFGQFAVKMTDQVLAEQDQAAKAGTRLSRGQIIQDIASDLEAQGGLTKSGEDVTGIDSAVMNRVFMDRLSGQDADQDNGDPKKREGILDL